MSEQKQSAPQAVADEDLDEVTGGGGMQAPDRKSWIFGYAGDDVDPQSEDGAAKAGRHHP